MVARAVGSAGLAVSSVGGSGLVEVLHTADAETNTPSRRSWLAMRTRPQLESRHFRIRLIRRHSQTRCAVGRRSVRWPAATMDFRNRHFPAEVILTAMRWYLRHERGYRDAEGLLAL